MLVAKQARSKRPAKAGGREGVRRRWRRRLGKRVSERKGAGEQWQLGFWGKGDRDARFYLRTS